MKFPISRIAVVIILCLILVPLILFAYAFGLTGDVNSILINELILLIDLEDKIPEKEANSNRIYAFQVLDIKPISIHNED